LSRSFANHSTRHKTIDESAQLGRACLGPDLDDGKHVLYVISDNDLNPSLATLISAFAIDGSVANLSFQPQFIRGPVYPPGKVKKALSTN
jgi:hypothetical protein